MRVSRELMILILPLAFAPAVHACDTCAAAGAMEGREADFPAWRPRRAPPLGLPADTVIAVIDGDSITADRYYAALPPNLASFPPPEEREARRGILENIVMLHILDQRLAKTGVRLSSADIDAELESHLRNMLSAGSGDGCRDDHGHSHGPASSCGHNHASPDD